MGLSTFQEFVGGKGMFLCFQKTSLWTQPENPAGEKIRRMKTTNTSLFIRVGLGCDFFGSYTFTHTHKNK